MKSQKLPDGTEMTFIYDVVAMRKKVNGQVRIMSVPPEEFLISRRAVDLQTAPFICHRVKKTVSDLILEGYDEKILEMIPSYTDTEAEHNQERLARFTYDDTDLPPDPRDGANKTVWIEECYVHVDFDGDGIAELKRLLKAETLDNHEIDYASQLLSTTNMDNRYC